MTQKTMDQLRAINRQMYLAQAQAFDVTRQNAWPGWDTLYNSLYLKTGEAPRTVLDVGCGNGRFGQYLTQKCGRTFEYTGIDQSRELLNKADETVSSMVTTHLIEADVFGNELISLTDGHRFDLVVLFGVLHHIPTTNARYKLLRQLFACSQPHGYVAVSFWQPMHHERFINKQLAWDSVGIDSDALDQGDYLLSFGAVKQPRYCHHFDDREIDETIERLDQHIVTDYRADGETEDLNRYLIWKSSSEE